MAEKKKGNKAAEKKAPVEEAHEEHHDEAPEAEKAAHDGQHEKAAHDDHGHSDHGHGHGYGDPHAHKPNIKEYMVIFAVLAILTVVEVAVAKVPGISHKLMALALVGLALTKAAIVGLYYMHLKHETRVLKLTVALPMAAPTIYALVLISEAAWRMTR